jgi:transposase
VFGIYDYTNDQMLIHSYKRKTSKQFLDFIKRVDRKYDSSIKQIFLVLDNTSIHKAKIVKESLARYYPRIHLVFLPTRMPELNLIEVRWLWLHRQAINNSVFNDEQDIYQLAYVIKQLLTDSFSYSDQIFWF